MKTSSELSASLQKDDYCESEFSPDCEPEPSEGREVKKASGYVYVGKNATEVKIGFSKWPHGRARALRIELQAYVPGTLADEQAFHQALEYFKLEGGKEWYGPNPRIEAIIDYMLEHGAVPPEIRALADANAALIAAKRCAKDAAVHARKRIYDRCRKRMQPFKAQSSAERGAEDA